MIHKEMEVYVDDMVVRSMTLEEHYKDLEKFLERLTKYNVRLNPKKCVFAVYSCKLLGYVVSSQGIEIDPDKIKAIQEMPVPKSETEIRSFLGHLQYISRFISRMSSICEPIFKLLKKNQPTEWNEQCQQAFEKIKQYLMNPPVLRPPQPGNMLILYLCVEDVALGAMLTQADEEGIEFAVYYLSKKLLPCEEKYKIIEKTCLAVVWATRKLRHYFQSYKVQVVSKMDPLKYLYATPSLIGKLGRWLILLSEFDIEYVTQKVIKGRAVAEFLAQQPVEDEQEIDISLPDEEIGLIESQGWKMYFDGAMNQKGAGIGVILVSPMGSFHAIQSQIRGFHGQ